jgi:hypothetical protein
MFFFFTDLEENEIYLKNEEARSVGEKIVGGCVYFTFSSGYVTFLFTSCALSQYMFQFIELFR